MDSFKAAHENLIARLEREGKAEEITRLRAELAAVTQALRDLVNRCDGEEGVRADDSNIDTTAAHAALGDFAESE